MGLVLSAKAIHDSVEGSGADVEPRMCPAEAQMRARHDWGTR